MLVDGTDPWLLVTNDDGPDSPALLPLLRELSQLGDVRVLIPDTERSWSSKTMTRGGRLRVVETEMDGFTVTTLNGSPADCANLGIHNIWPTPPALVVSGVNMGANAGLSFLLSSGTVAAAVEGMWLAPLHSHNARLGHLVAQDNAGADLTPSPFSNHNFLS